MKRKRLIETILYINTLTCLLNFMLIEINKTEWNRMMKKKKKILVKANKKPNTYFKIVSLSRFTCVSLAIFDLQWLSDKLLLLLLLQIKFDKILSILLLDDIYFEFVEVALEFFVFNSLDDNDEDDDDDDVDE